MSQKQPKLKVIIHAFRLFRDLSSERHGMPPRDMGVHLKGVMWLGTNIRMPLLSLRGDFGFHENEQMRCLETFRGNTNSAKHPRNITSRIDFSRYVSGENTTRHE